MPVNNALTPEGQNALGAAFGYYPQLRRNRTVQDPRLAAEMPLQFLRGRAAATLGLPSDVANLVRSPMPMEMFGDVDYGQQAQVPYGSQELLKTLPLPPQGPAQAAAANVGAVAPLSPMEALQAARAARQAALAGGKALGPTAERMAADYLQRQGLILPLDVYQGTPHTFPPTARNPLGEFDASKIGTGEGAQAYGRGVYTAENPTVAKEYQVKLSSTGSAKNLAGNFGGIDDGLAEANRRVEHYKKLIADGGGGAMSRAKSMLQISKKNVADLQAMKAGIPENKGNLYKADLPDAMIPKMLDWDKPLSQQPEIMKALTPEAMGLKLRIAPESGFMGYVSPDGVPIGLQVKGATPENFRKKWLDRIAEFGEAEGGAGRVIGYLGGTSETSAAQVSAALRQAGIPGIKYLDEGSRGPAQIFNVGSPREGFGPYSPYTSMEEAKKQLELLKKYGFKDAEVKIQNQPQTRNFVTFPGEEKNLTIFERNGQKR